MQASHHKQAQTDTSVITALTLLLAPGKRRRNRETEISRTSVNSSGSASCMPIMVNILTHRYMHLFHFSKQSDCSQRSKGHKQTQLKRKLWLWRSHCSRLPVTTRGKISTIAFCSYAHPKTPPTGTSAARLTLGLITLIWGAPWVKKITAMAPPWTLIGRLSKSSWKLSEEKVTAICEELRLLYGAGEEMQACTQTNHRVSAVSFMRHERACVYQGW